jgi:hypothetical protein
MVFVQVEFVELEELWSAYKRFTLNIYDTFYYKLHEAVYLLRRTFQILGSAVSIVIIQLIRYLETVYYTTLVSSAFGYCRIIFQAIILGK